MAVSGSHKNTLCKKKGSSSQLLHWAGTKWDNRQRVQMKIQNKYMFALTVVNCSVDWCTSPYNNGEGISMSLKQIFFSCHASLLHMHSTVCYHGDRELLKNVFTKTYTILWYMLKLLKTTNNIVTCTGPATTSAVILQNVCITGLHTGQEHALQPRTS